jgi:hypothetical protein
LDDVEQLAVAEILRGVFPHVGRRRIQVASDGGIATSVVGVA